MKTLAIIGSTGSIGKSALNVFKKNRHKLKLIYLASNSNYQALSSQVKKFKPKYFFLFNNKNKHKIKNKKFITFDKVLKNKNKKIDYIVSGVASYDALKINLNLTKICKNLLIANKETIICGNKIFLNYAKKNNCKIISIDSEHHCIDHFFSSNNLINKIEKIYLTASGGPFLNKPINYKEKISNVLNHPNWKMGKKITVDSSTLANKVLELFEANILFNLKPSMIGVIIESNSLVHAIIKFKNKFYYPIMHYPCMEIPITNALKLKNNKDINFKKININFSNPDLKKFPILKLGHKILDDYGYAGMIIFTVLNEKLVKMYLNKEINYGDIVYFLVKIFKRKEIIQKSSINIKSIKDVYKVINYAKSINL